MLYTLYSRHAPILVLPFPVLVAIQSPAFPRLSVVSTLISTSRLAPSRSFAGRRDSTSFPSIASALLLHSFAVPCNSSSCFSIVCALFTKNAGVSPYPQSPVPRRSPLTPLESILTKIQGEGGPPLLPGHPLWTNQEVCPSRPTVGSRGTVSNSPPSARLSHHPSPLRAKIPACPGSSSSPAAAA